MKKATFLSRVIATASVAALAWGGFFISWAQAVSLGVTQITAVKTYAEADGTFENGWQWVFDVTVPDEEPVLQMKFGNWTGILGSIPAAENIRFYSSQSNNAPAAAEAVMITAAGVYSAEMYLNPVADLNALAPGRQIQVWVEARIPEGSAAGAYSNSYGLRSTADLTPPVITLEGDNPHTIERGAAYVELGATAEDAVYGVVAVTPDDSAVNPDLAGTYEVTYRATDGAGNVGAAARTVVVEDTVAPTAEITYSTTALTNQDVIATLVPKEPVTVTNNGGLLTHTFPANGTFTFEFEDPSGNGGSATAEVNNIDKVAPVLTLDGDAAVTVERGEDYEDEGAEAEDDVDGDISDQVTLTIEPNGAINTKVIGEYTLTYNVSDTAGNAALPVVRTVRIEDTIPPEIEDYEISQLKFSPNGDGVKDTTSIDVAFSEPVRASIKILDGSGTLIRDLYQSNSVTNPNAKIWDGRDGAGNLVPSGVGYVVEITISDAAGHQLVDASQAIIVDTDAPVISLDGVASEITLGGEYEELGATATDNVDGEFPATPSGTVEVERVGVYSITYNATDEAGNSATPVERPVTVVAKMITAEVTVADKTYDGTGAAAITACELEGVLAGQDVTCDWGAAEAHFENGEAGKDKTVTVTGLSLTGADQDNYLLASATVTAEADIDPLTLAGSIIAENKVYDGDDQATISACDLSGVIAGDEVVCETSGERFADKHIGSDKEVTANLSLSGAEADNYEVNENATTQASVTPRSITVTAAPNEKVYDGTTSAAAIPEIGGAGLAPGDQPSFTEVYEDPNVGTEKLLIPEGEVIDGNNGANYEVDFTSTNTGTITKAGQTITFGPLPADPLVGDSFDMEATSDSGLEVVFEGTTPEVCTVEPDGTVNLHKSGSCTVVANQVGNENYESASASKTFTVRYVIGGEGNTAIMLNPADYPVIINEDVK